MINCLINENKLNHTLANTCKRSDRSKKTLCALASAYSACEVWRRMDKTTDKTEAMILKNENVVLL